MIQLHIWQSDTARNQDFGWERGQKRRKPLVIHIFCFFFVYPQICRGILDSPKKGSLPGGLFNFKKLTKDIQKLSLSIIHNPCDFISKENVKKVPDVKL